MMNHSLPRNSRFHVDGWTIGNQLGYGSSGPVFEVTGNSGERAILKIGNNADIEVERRVYELVGCERGFPLFYGTRVLNGAMAIITQRLAKDFNEYSIAGKGLSSKDILKLAQQLIRRLKMLHNSGFVHRDLHPGNIMIGEEESLENGTIFLIDFNIAKKYRDENGNRYPNEPVVGNFGMPLFVSLKVHQEKSISPRDDMESAAYLFKYLFNRKLPWEDVEDDDADDTASIYYAEMERKKRELSPEEIMEGMPSSFSKYLHDIRSLDFGEQPKYDQYIQWFEDSLASQGLSSSDLFDWQTLMLVPNEYE